MLFRSHAVDLAAGPDGGGPAFTLAALAAYLGKRARRVLFPAATGPEQQFLARVLGPRDGTGDSEPEGPTVPVRWLHGDLSHDHVLFDPGTGAVSAILDFGDLRRGDPAWDLVFLYRDYGPGFVARLLGTYAPPDPAALLCRVYHGYQLVVLDGACDAAGPGAAARARGAMDGVRSRIRSIAERPGRAPFGCTVRVGRQITKPPMWDSFAKQVSARGS